jgi:geranylgeranyl pyrophosphate synthase
MRRGDLCTYKKFGTDVAVNAGNFMYIAPMNKMSSFVAPKHHETLLKIFMSEM